MFALRLHLFDIWYLWPNCSRAKTVNENLKIGAALLSRFDLVFILLDKPDELLDKRVSEHIMSVSNHVWPVCGDIPILDVNNIRHSYLSKKTYTIHITKENVSHADYVFTISMKLFIMSMVGTSKLFITQWYERLGYLLCSFMLGMEHIHQEPKSNGEVVHF